MIRDKTDEVPEIKRPPKLSACAQRGGDLGRKGCKLRTTVHMLSWVGWGEVVRVFPQNLDAVGFCGALRDSDLQCASYS